MLPIDELEVEFVDLCAIHGEPRMDPPKDGELDRRLSAGGL